MGVRWVALASLIWAGSAWAGSPGGKRLWTEAKQRKVSAQRSELAVVARRAMPAVVSITTEQLSAQTDASSPAQRGLGAGFVIHPDGYILTASHVIENSSEIRATLVDAQGNPTEYLAKVVGQDVPTDFAILKIDAGRKLPVLPLGSAEHVEVADWIVAIGNPFGLGHSVTVGVVSFKGRTDVTPNGREGFFDYLQTDASINPGNSGGPVLDLSGEVVAIANAVNVAGQGIAFAIPIDIAKAVIPQLIEHGSIRRGWMGVSVQDLTPELAGTYEIDAHDGVVISDVFEGGPGFSAGLRSGDVIEGFAQRRVQKAQALRWQVSTAGVGNTVDMKIRRGHKRFIARVKLEDIPEQQEQLRAIQGDSSGDDATTPASTTAVTGLGAQVVEVDKATSLRAGLSLPFGALVREVDPSGTGAQAGLARGDVVLKVNAREVASKADLLEELERLAPGSAVRLFVRRGPQTLQLAFRKPR